MRGNNKHLSIGFYIGFIDDQKRSFRRNVAFVSREVSSMRFEDLNLYLSTQGLYYKAQIQEFKLHQELSSRFIRAYLLLVVAMKRSVNVSSDRGI